MKNLFKSPRALRIYGIASLSLAALCIIFRTIGYLFFFDSDIGYFKRGSVIGGISEILPAVSVVLALIVCAVSRLSPHAKEVYGGKAIKISAFFPAIGFAGYAIVYAIQLIDYIPIISKVPVTYWILLASSIIASVFFFLYAIRKNNGNVLFVLSGFFVIVWLVVSLAESYFDAYVQMNSPMKTGFQYAILCAILLIVNEMRVDLDVKRPRFHLFSATISTVFLGAVSISSIVASLFGKMPDNYILFYSDCVLFTLFVFAAVRLIGLCFPTKGYKAFVQMIHDIANNYEPVSRETPAQDINNETANSESTINTADGETQQ